MGDDTWPADPVNAFEIVDVLNPFLIPISVENGFIPELLNMVKLLVWLKSLLLISHI